MKTSIARVGVDEFALLVFKNSHLHMIHVVEWVAANGPLRDGRTVEAAGETVWLLTSAEVYRLLMVDRGWPRDRYEQWLGDTLIALLLPVRDW